jgi:hypothetical protein
MAQRRHSGEQEKDWHFFSFPVFAGFSAGALFATLFIGLTGLLGLVWIAAMFGVSFSAAHIIARALRKRTLDSRIQREEEEERERRALAARAAAARGDRAPEGASSGVVRRRRRRRT